MANQFTETKQEKDEFSRIFSDYRTRLDEISRQMQKNLGFEIPEPDPPVPEPENIVTEVQAKAELEPGEMFPGVNNEPVLKEEASPAQERPEPVVVKESEEIIREAKKNASRILAEAEKRIKDEAKKKTELQISKIIAQAQKEAQEIIAKARHYNDDLKTEAINAVKQQAQQSIDEIIEGCRQQAYEQSSLIIHESREKAVKIMNDMLAAAKEMSQVIEEATAGTSNTVNDFETKIKAGNETLLKAISQSQNKFLQITAVIEEKPKERKPDTEPQVKHKEIKNSPGLVIRLMGNNHDTHADGLFHGKIEVKSVSSAFDYTQLKNLKKYFVRFPAIKCIQESASEKAVTMLFNIGEPLPLIEILNNIPLIDEVVLETENSIRLTFRQPDQS